MLIQVVKGDVEEYIIDGPENHKGKSVNRNLFQCCFSELTLPTPKQDDFLGRCCITAS